MSDDFDLRLRRELRALADAVPTGPVATAALAATPAHELGVPQPVSGRIRMRHSPPIGFSAAGLLTVIAIVAGAALFGGWHNGNPGVSERPSASPRPSISPGYSAATAVATISIVQPHVVESFGTDQLRSPVIGPDGAAYVLDYNGTGTAGAYRLDLTTGARLTILAYPGPNGSIAGAPSLLTTAGPDVLILDSFHNLWRWRPAPGDTTGRGTLTKVNIDWGVGAGDVRVMRAFVANSQLGEYDLYVADPGRQIIIRYSRLGDGSFQAVGRFNYLIVPPDQSSVDDMYVDGNVYVVDAGKITKFDSGEAVHGWSPAVPVVPNGRTPYYTHVAASDPTQNLGTLYAYDESNDRIAAFSKLDGSLVGLYVVPAGSTWFRALTGMFVITGTDGSNPALYWTEAGNLINASLAPTATPTPLPSSRSSASSPS